MEVTATKITQFETNSKTTRGLKFVATLSQKFCENCFAKINVTGRLKYKFRKQIYKTQSAKITNKRELFTGFRGVICGSSSCCKKNL